MKQLVHIFTFKTENLPLTTGRGSLIEMDKTVSTPIEIGDDIAISFNDKWAKFSFIATVYDVKPNGKYIDVHYETPRMSPTPLPEKKSPRRYWEYMNASILENALV